MADIELPSVSEAIVGISRWISGSYPPNLDREAHDLTSPEQNEEVFAKALAAGPLRSGDSFSATSEIDARGKSVLKDWSVTRGGLTMRAHKMTEEEIAESIRNRPPVEPTTPADDVLEELAREVGYGTNIEHAEKWLKDRGWVIRHVDHSYPDRWDYTYDPAGSKSCTVCGHTIHD
jgi:hypothetical protein